MKGIHIIISNGENNVLQSINKQVISSWKYTAITGTTQQPLFISHKQCNFRKRKTIIKPTSKYKTKINDNGSHVQTYCDCSMNFCVLIYRSN
uniref:Uncharacterized protein n=1 Tax=Arion vulgaris TaxID=1028688 RepID=A0A0B6YEG1_9EUPU